MLQTNTILIIVFTPRRKLKCPRSNNKKNNTGPWQNCSRALSLRTFDCGFLIRHAQLCLIKSLNLMSWTRVRKGIGNDVFHCTISARYADASRTESACRYFTDFSGDHGDVVFGDLLPVQSSPGGDRSRLRVDAEVLLRIRSPFQRVPACQRTYGWG